LKAYPLKIGNLEYIVSGPGDMMSTPPSARGFSLKIFEKGTGRYATVYRAYEENGYGFLIYTDDDKKLILKGGQGSDHKETIYARSEELQNIRKEKYKEQSDTEFLRRTCLSGRAWQVNLNNKIYYFVSIWNVSITPKQVEALNEYLAKLPKSNTYIQMGMAGSGPSSEFGLVGSFTPKISSSTVKISKKQKQHILTPHLVSPMLPKAYSDQLKKLSMKENYEKFAELAKKLIAKLEKIQSVGKTKTPSSDIVSNSSLKSVILGLGNQYPDLSKKLQSLEKFSFNHSDLAKLHGKAKVDMSSWSDTSLNENAEMAMSDVHKIIKYSNDVQQLFSVQDNLEDWVKAKLNHACDYVATVRDYLKFYRDEKEAGTPLNQIDEKWTNKYKKSINCSNPKGFSQKAHCRARKLRQSGQSTSSKPVREVYKEVTNQLLKEFNSSMAMGALKQIHNDAKELESMLQPDTQLEDWVKAKLNLAGEYLDDVYHHLDHFGPKGRTLDDVYMARQLAEGWRDWLAAAAIGASTLGGVAGLEAKPIKVSRQLVPINKPAITQTVATKPSDVSLDQSFVDYIKNVENAGKKGYNKKKKLWFPHESFEGGSDTIGYGHKIQKGEDFSKGITDAQAEALLKRDLEKAKSIVNKEVGGRQLSKKQMEMFVDFVFNMGTLNKFPKFTEFALKNDLQGMKAQYKRFAGGKELKGRNSAFLQRFLTEYFGFNYYF